MHLSIFKSLAVVVPASLAVGSGTSLATVIFNQNFDDTTVFPTNNPDELNAFGNGVAPQGRWSQSDSTNPGPTPRADPDPAYAGDQAMLMRRNGPGYTGLKGYLFDTNVNIPSGTFTFQYSVYRVDPNSAFTVNVENNTLIDTHYPLGVSVSTTGVLSTSYTADEGGYGPRPTPTDPYVIPQGVWTTLRYEVNMDAGTWDLFVTDGDGNTTQVLTDYAFAKDHLGPVNYVAFMPSGGPNDVGNTFYVDDIYLGNEPVPEPVTGGFLLVGGLLALTTRRRRQ